MQPRSLTLEDKLTVGFGIAGLVGVVAAMIFLLRPNASESDAGAQDPLSVARHLLDQNRPDQALATITAHHQTGPAESAERAAIAGMALAQMGEVAQARRLLEQSLMAKPEQADVAKYLAAIYLSRGDAERGIVLLRMAIEHDPDDVRPWLALGRVYHDMGALDKAADAYDEAVKRDPENVEARLGRIEELILDNRPDEATAWLEEELARGAESARLLGLAARHAQSLAQPDQAGAYAARALELDPKNVEALIVRSQWHLYQDQADDALRDLEQAVENNPNHLRALNMLAQVESRLGLKDRADATLARHKEVTRRAQEMDRLTQQITTDPENPEPRWEMGLLALEGDQHDLALQCFQAALDVDPTFQPARDSLASLRAERSDSISPGTTLHP